MRIAKTFLEGVLVTVPSAAVLYALRHHIIVGACVTTIVAAGLLWLIYTWEAHPTNSRTPASQPQGSLDDVIRVELIDPPPAEPYSKPVRWQIWLRANLTAETHAFQAKVVNLHGVANPIPLCPWPIPWRSRVTTDCELAPAETEILRLATADPVYRDGTLPTPSGLTPLTGNWKFGRVAFHVLHIGTQGAVEHEAYLADVHSWEDLSSLEMHADIMIWEVGVPAPPPALTRTLAIGFTADATMRLGFVY